MDPTPEEQLRKELNHMLITQSRLYPRLTKKEVNQIMAFVRTTILNSKPEKLSNKEDESKSDYFYGYGYNAGVDAAFAAIMEALGGTDEKE